MRTNQTRVCTVANCTRPQRARGWCSPHWSAWKRNGDPEVRQRLPYLNDPIGTIELFLDRSGGSESCWLWSGPISPEGYGRVGGNRLYVHRVAYEYWVGPIQDGFELDHLCRNRACGNPAHLEAVSHRVNVIRGISPFATFATATECKRGHPKTPANTYVRPDGRGSMCRPCQKLRRERHRHTKLPLSL